MYHLATRSFCPICDAQSEHVDRFRSSFPDLSPSRGQNGFRLDEDPDTATLTIAECQACGVYHASPLPSVQEIRDFYEQAEAPNDWEVEHYVFINPHAQESWASFVARLERLIGGTGTLLEVGCAAGWILKAAQDRGWQVRGIEAAPKFQRFARDQLGLPVDLGSIEDVDPTGLGTFDVILMLDVLEHVLDPVDALSKLRALSKAGTYLVFTVPKIDSFFARLYGLRWRQIVVSHLYYWTPTSMEIALKRSGFRPIEFSEPRYWDPDPRLRRLGAVRESFKLLARVLLRATYVPLSHKIKKVSTAPARLSSGRITHEDLMHKIGDQPVLGDVMLVVARPM